MAYTRLTTLWVAAAAVFAVAAASNPAHAGERRIATLAPDGSAWVKILDSGARALAKETDGRIAIKLFPGGVQGDEKDVVRKIRLKQLDGAALTTVGLSIIYPGIRVLQLPFLFESVEEVDYVRDKMWPYFEEKFKEKGFKLAYPGDVGWTFLYANREITSVSDMQGVKFWAWSDDPIVRAYFKRLDIPNVPLGVPEVLGALKTGRINGCYGSPLAAVALQWYTEVNHASTAPVAYGVGAMVIRYDAWEASSAQDKSVEEQIGRKVGAKLVERVRKDNLRARSAMEKSGVKFVDSPKALNDKLRTEAEALWKQLAGDVYSKAELDMVLKYRAEYRAKK